MSASKTGFEISNTSLQYLYGYFKEHIPCSVLRVEYHFAPPVTDESNGMVKVRFTYTVPETEQPLDVSVLIAVTSGEIHPDVAVYATADGNFDEIDCITKHEYLYTEEFMKEIIEALNAYADTLGNNE